MNKAGVAAGGLVFAATALLSFLSTWEGDEQYTVFADLLANGLPTVCRGLTRHVTTTPIVIGERWSKAKCDAEEVKAIMALQVRLLACFGYEPPQSVFDAATSHGWNNGAPNTCGSQAMQAWRSGDLVRGCHRIARSDAGKPVWSYVRTGRTVNGKPEYKFIQGLANRREAEVNYCLRDVEQAQ